MPIANTVTCIMFLVRIKALLDNKLAKDKYFQPNFI